MIQPLKFKTEQDVPDDLELGTPYIIDVIPEDIEKLLNNVEEYVVKRDKVFKSAKDKYFAKVNRRRLKRIANRKNNSESTNNSSNSNTSSTESNQNIPNIYWGKAKNVKLFNGGFTKKFKIKAFDAYAHIHQVVKDTNSETLLPIKDIEFQINSINTGLVIGLNENPENREDYKDIKYGLYFWKNVIFLFNGANEGKYGTWKTSDTFYLTVTESQVILKQNDIEIIKYDKENNKDLFFDNVIYMSQDSGLINVKANGQLVKTLFL